VRPAHRDNLLSELRAEEWLLIEWPQDETEPPKYWFSTLSEDTAFDRLVDLTNCGGGSSATRGAAARHLGTGKSLRQNRPNKRSADFWCFAAARCRNAEGRAHVNRHSRSSYGTDTVCGSGDGLDGCGPGLAALKPPHSLLSSALPAGRLLGPRDKSRRRAPVRRRLPIVGDPLIDNLVATDAVHYLWANPRELMGDLG
jgi:hypothetical protein